MSHQILNLIALPAGKHAAVLMIATCVLTFGCTLILQRATSSEGVLKPACSMLPNEVAGIYASVLVDRYAAIYARYGHQWLQVKERLHQFCKQAAKRPRCLSDELEMEMSYFRIRAFRPKIVWEISPADGFSTLMILNALQDNDNGGKLISFDISSSAEAFIPAKFRRRGRWELRVGDIRKSNLSNEPLPDYLFLDSWHSYEMAQFYTTSLLPSFKRKHVPVSLHDAYNPSFWVDDGKGRNLSIHPAWMPNAEAIVVIDWLKDQPYVCGSYSISKYHASVDVYNAFLEMRLKTFGEEACARGISNGMFSSNQPNPTLFFELNCPLRSWCSKV